MIKFVTVDRIQPGVTLARDIYGIDTFTGRITMLKAGQTLTMAHITRLMGLDLQGVYINEKTTPIEIMQESTKVKLANMFDDFHDHIDLASAELRTDLIDEANEVIEGFVDFLLTKDDIKLDVDSLNLHENLRYNHSLGITVVCVAIGKQLRIPRDGLRDLALAAMLHDIGDTKVPTDILNKPAKLSNDEFSVVQTHTTKGFEMANQIGTLSNSTKDGVLYHHERYDGSGYPKGLKGKQIPLFARIIAVADVYSALTSSRPYRSAYQAAEAIEYIMGNAGRQFDSGVVKAFLKVVSPYPIGSCVKLSSGEKAVVAEQNAKNPLRPVIFLMDDPAAMIDLYNDKCFYNVVITDLVEE